MGIESSAALATPVDALRQSRPEVTQHDRGSMLRARIAVGRVRGDLFMPGIDEFYRLALGEFREHSDIRMTAQAEDVFHAAMLEVFHELSRNQLFHNSLLGAPQCVAARLCSR